MLHQTNSPLWNMHFLFETIIMEVPLKRCQISVAAISSLTNS